jgi:hypothetical protein
MFVRQSRSHYFVPDNLRERDIHQVVAVDVSQFAFPHPEFNPTEAVGGYGNIRPFHHGSLDGPLCLIEFHYFVGCA